MAVFSISEPVDFEVGDRIGASATFTRTSDQQPVSPTTVTAKVRKPDNTLVEYTGVDIIPVGVGEYYIVIDIDMAGRWYYSFYGTPDVMAAGDNFFDVSLSEVLRL